MAPLEKDADVSIIEVLFWEKDISELPS